MVSQEDRDCQVVILQDVVISQKAVEKLALGGWRYFHDTRTDEWVFDRSIWVNEATMDIYELRDKRLPEVLIRIVADTMFHFKTLDFCWRDRARIEPDSPVGELLAQYTMLLIDEVGYHSFSRDIVHHTLTDYPRVLDYISHRCEETYHVPVPVEIPILICPEGLWSTWGFSKGVEALYTPVHRYVVIPDKRWTSLKWRDGILVHEFTHRIQHLKRWILYATDLDLTSQDMQSIGRMLAADRSLEEVAAICRMPVTRIKRVKGLLDERAEYQSKYWELPTEVMAFGEEYGFLKSLGLDAATIYDAIVDYMELKGSYPTRRDKDRLLLTVEEDSVKVAQSIAELEELVDEDPQSDLADVRPPPDPLGPG